MRQFFIVLSLVYLLEASQKCSDIKKGEPPCCTGSKNFSCLGNWTLEECNCHPHKMTKDGAKVVNDCEWNVVYDKYAEDGTTQIMPCSGFTKHCNYDRNTPKISCIALWDDGDLLYPPMLDRIPKSDENKLHEYKKVYCRLTRDGHDAVAQEDFYKVLPTCFLFECDIRFRKPEETLSDKWTGDGRNEWCWPPVDGISFIDDYCALYETDPDTDIDHFDFRGYNGCLLPPFCDSALFEADKKTLRIDGKLYMYPLSTNPEARARGEVNVSHCELLCPENNNTGYWHGQRCRVRPSCLSLYFQKPVNDVFHVRKCLPWCSGKVEKPSPDDYKRFGRTMNCNNRPVCLKDDEVPAEFSEENPYASEYCIPSRECVDGETPKTHFCTSKGDSEGGKVTGNPRTTTAASVMANMTKESHTITFNMARGKAASAVFILALLLANF